MATKTEKIAFTQVLKIINNVEDEYYKKIPTDIIETLKKNQTDYYQYFDDNGEEKLSDLATQILCYLNLEYWCNEQEKKEFINIYKKNDETATEKYDVNEIFMSRKNTKDNNKTKGKEMVKYKENWLKKLFKRFFGKKNK